MTGAKPVAALVKAALGDDLRLGPGDALVLACAVAFALHIVAVGRFAPTSARITWLHPPGAAPASRMAPTSAC